MKSQVLQMKLVGKTPFRFISCLYYSTENGSVDNWHVLIHTQLDKTGTHDGRTHRAWPAIISLDSKSIELRMNMHQQCLSVWCSPSPLHVLQRYYFACMMVYLCWSVSSNWRTRVQGCTHQLLAVLWWPSLVYTSKLICQFPILMRWV